MRSDAPEVAEREKRRPRKPRGEKSYLPDIHRLLPASADSELGVLCSLLLDPQRVMQQLEERGVHESWFHLPAYSLMFDLIRAMHGARMQIDVITLTQAARDQEILDQVGGAAGISQAFTFLPTAANVGYYVDILAAKFAAREMIRVCTEFAARAYEEQDGDAIGELVDEAQAAILAVNRPEADAAQAHIQHIKEGVSSALTAIEETYAARSSKTVLGLPTGIHALDRMTGGMRGPLLIIIAGRPSMGKSALLWQIAEHLSIILGKPVLGFSLEMNLTELASRMICGRGKVNLQRVRDGFLSHDMMNRTLPAAVKAVMGAPIWIDETPAISIQELRTRVRRFIRRHPDTAAVFVDYLQLMRSSSKRAQENRALEIGEISSGLKRLAREINRPVIAAAQLNRDNDGPKTPPKLSNLRESGSIEQDADWALLLHRKHYYTKHEDDKGKATIDLAKQRNGPTGEIQLGFNSELARFENPEGETLYSNDPSKRQNASEDEP